MTQSDIRIPPQPLPHHPLPLALPPLGRHNSEQAMPNFSTVSFWNFLPWFISRLGGFSPTHLKKVCFCRVHLHLLRVKMNQKKMKQLHHLLLWKMVSQQKSWETASFLVEATFRGRSFYQILQKMLPLKRGRVVWLGIYTSCNLDLGVVVQTSWSHCKHMKISVH